MVAANCVPGGGGLNCVEDSVCRVVEPPQLSVFIVARLAGRWIQLLGGSLTGGKGVEARDCLTLSCGFVPGDIVQINIHQQYLSSEKHNIRESANVYLKGPCHRIKFFHI